MSSRSKKASGATFESLPVGYDDATIDATGDESPPEEVAPERYEILDTLGQGGMGTVYRVLDRHLGRTVALKVLRGSDGGSRVARFREEANLTARLQHPGIVPVHDVGEMPDGRMFFTMKEIRGHTFGEEIARLHALPLAEWDVGLRRALASFQRACEAIAYAHAAGVLHRDIKPSNLMIGGHGEVLVVDWGLALSAGSRSNAVVGTPAYMPPEQARGESVGPEADVYALGACLYEILTGFAPRSEPLARALLAAAAAERPFPSPRERRPDLPIPEALEALTLGALQARPALRPAHAGLLAGALDDWLAGAERRQRALAHVAEADERASEAERLRVRAAEQAEASAAQLAALPPDAAVEDHQPGWDLEDAARATLALAEREESARLAALGNALSHAPDLAEAHDRLATWYHAQHRALEAAGQFDEARKLEGALREHGRGQFTAYLAGVGALTLLTEPAGAEALLYRYQRRRRRLEPVFVRSLGHTPLRAVPLEMGNYLVVLRTPGLPDTHYPVRILRGEHWDGVPPGASEPAVISLPADLAPGEIYVPAGWFISDATPAFQLVPMPRRRLWCHGFVIQEHPVTFGDYVRFLDALLAAGDVAGRDRWQPLQNGKPILAADAAGHHVPIPDAHGELCGLDWPVFLVDHPAAVTYAAWRAATDGRPWQVPLELEWEKAARGVDERQPPWGDDFDPHWAHTQLPAGRPPGPGRIGVPEEDRSPYRVHGLAGNVMCWTDDPLQTGMRAAGDRVEVPPPVSADQTLPPGIFRAFRGGSFGHGPRMCAIGVRMYGGPLQRHEVLGIRLLRRI